MFKRFIKPKSVSKVSALTSASLLGLHLVSGIIAGGLFGYAFDYWLESSPKGLMIGVLVGIVAGFKNLYVDAKRLIEKQDSRQEQEK